MASLFLLNAFCKKLKPNTFVKAKTNSDILISSIIKFKIESTLLTYEMTLYNALLAIPIIFPEPNYPLFIFPLSINLLSSIPVIYGIPIYRTLKSLKQDKLQIINFIK